MGADNSLETSLIWLQNLVKGDIGQELEARALKGLKITHAQKGFLRFSFIVPSSASV
ncbi:hypothetical protein CCACVL1_28097 [Corchorus capsularis]|uniref:Uncharacterized protein n=1 Tax=Corchorus capsularis TaxID=210143 RepID=A0A1R3G7K7_COCAP|nr:hypothetical protein CCACVL1_28097 [Corchorus capsularis]